MFIYRIGTTGSVIREKELEALTREMERLGLPAE